MSKRVEIVFTQDVEGVAKKGEQRVVAGGYWRNFLSSRGLAVLAGSSEGRRLLSERVKESETEGPPETVEVPVSVKPKLKEEKKAKRVARKEAKKRKETKKAVRLKSKVKKGKE